MSGYTTPTWGYKIISDKQIHFYHVLLPKIPLQSLQSHLPEASVISKKIDGSISISLRTQTYSSAVIEKLVHFFKRAEYRFLETPKYHYKIPKPFGQTLKEWTLSFEGCLALLLIHNQRLEEFSRYEWCYINSAAGGLVLGPFTLLLNSNYPKIIHPITIQNFEIRNMIEKETASLVNTIISRLKKARKEDYGLTLIHFVKEKIKKTEEEICKIINNKSVNVQSRTYSSFFSI